MALFAVVQRAAAGCGRNRNQTWANVVVDVRSASPAFAQIAAGPFATNPTHFVVELTQQQYNALKSGWTHDGNANLPKWQNRTDDPGGSAELGSFSNPQNVLSAWTANSPIADDRLIIRIYDKHPVSGTPPITHLAAEDLDEAVGSVERFIRVFTPADSPSGSDAQNVKVEIGGRMMIFDLTDGISNIFIATDEVGRILFPSSHEYRVVGPNGEKEVLWRVFGRTLRVR